MSKQIVFIGGLSKNARMLNFEMHETGPDRTVSERDKDPVRCV